MQKKLGGLGPVGEGGCVEGGQSECERRIEVIVKMQKNVGRGVKVDVNEDLKLL